MHWESTTITVIAMETSIHRDLTEKLNTCQEKLNTINKRKTKSISELQGIRDMFRFVLAFLQHQETHKVDSSKIVSRDLVSIGMFK